MKTCRDGEVRRGQYKTRRMMKGVGVGQEEDESRRMICYVLRLVLIE